MPENGNPGQTDELGGVGNRIFSLSTKGISVVQGRKLNVADAVDKDKWEEVIAYARALGVPENQCDFLPEDFE